MVSDGINVSLRKKELEALIAYSGMGMLNCYYTTTAAFADATRWTHKFNLFETDAIEIGTEKKEVTVFVPDLPFSGFMNPNLTGCIAAPATKIILHEGKDIILMYFHKGYKTQSVQSATSNLRVSNKNGGECTIHLAQNKNGLSIVGDANGLEHKSIRIELTRCIGNESPNWPNFDTCCTEVLGTFEKGSFVIEWQPVTRQLEEDVLIAFNPASNFPGIWPQWSHHNPLFKILAILGAELDKWPLLLGPGNFSKNTFLLSDGPVLSYNLSLVMNGKLSGNTTSTSSLSLES